MGKQILGRGAGAAVRQVIRVQGDAVPAEALPQPAEAVHLRSGAFDGPALPLFEADADDVPDGFVLHEEGDDALTPVFLRPAEIIQRPAKLVRQGGVPAASADDWLVGSRVHRIDVEEKVQGYGLYPDDVYVEGMCYGGAVRSPYARARITKIDISQAQALPGVVAVITAEDIPGENKVGHIKHDQYSLIPVGGLTHWLGDPIALVVAEDQETLEKAKKLVKVTYEPLPAVHDPEDRCDRERIQRQGLFQQLSQGLQ